MIGKNRNLTLVIALCLVLATLGATAAARGNDCDATLHPVLYRVIRKDTTILHRFKVDVSSPARCADVYYTLKVVEEATGGKKESKRKSIKTTVRDGVVTTAMVGYEMPAKKTMTSWKIELVKCSPCGAGKTQ